MDRLRNIKTTGRRIKKRKMYQSTLTVADIENLLSNGGSLLCAGSQFEGNMESDYTIHVDTNFYGNIFQ